VIAAAYEMWLFIRGGSLDRRLLIEPGVGGTP